MCGSSIPISASSARPRCASRCARGRRSRPEPRACRRSPAERAFTAGRALIAVVAAILDGQPGIQNDVFCRIEGIRVDQSGVALIGGETLLTNRDRFLGPFYRQLPVQLRDPFVTARIAKKNGMVFGQV